MFNLVYFQKLHYFFQALKLSFGSDLISSVTCTQTCLPNQAHSATFPSGLTPLVVLFNPPSRVTVLEKTVLIKAKDSLHCQILPYCLFLLLLSIY